MTEEPLSTDMVINRFISEMQRAAEASSGHLVRDSAVEPVTFSDYQTVCREFLSLTEVLPESLLARWLAYITQNSKLKLHFPEGYTCCLAIIPFTTYGNPLTSEEIERGDYLKILIVNPEGKTVSGFSINSSFVSDLLPLEVRKLAFQIEKYDKEEPYQITHTDRQRLAANFEKAFRGFKLLLAKNPE